MKKKIVSLVLVAALAFTALVGTTLAYFTDKTEAAKNTFTVGNVKIKLEEPAWTASGEKDAPEVYPGEALAKDPTVTNIGKNPCFVRVKVTGLDQFGNKGEITLRHGNYVAGYDDTNWKFYDGYYYYKKVLATKDTAGQGLGTVTEPLFNQIVMPVGLTGGEATVSIDIYAEAVQAQGAKASWSDVKAMTVEEIAAWFTTCGM